MWLSLVAEEGKESRFRTSVDRPVGTIIPRDPLLIIPEMNLENDVTALTNASLDHRLFHPYSIDLSERSTSSFALHVEIHPLAINLSYLTIYVFDCSAVLTSSHQEIDGWTPFCPPNQTTDHLSTHFFSNHQPSFVLSLIGITLTKHCSS